MTLSIPRALGCPKPPSPSPVRGSFGAEAALLQVWEIPPSLGRKGWGQGAGKARQGPPPGLGLSDRAVKDPVGDPGAPRTRPAAPIHWQSSDWGQR